ncbi:malto-oligosyltrehalose synthase [Geotalea sp. SG265]|uniref:malto-oligosyltrehalose synthase n=1 Tax=Geotalea sp. SG265 TaxID=2922867 RepID=UPI001FAFA95E|nr:malto-oligosyltrehalose synthase [Geotalea sp. SG265]
MANENPPAARIPAATYRLQFNRQFGFAAAQEIVSYLSDLGVTDIYASSYLTAKEGSLHGYDVVDQNRLNWEIGTPDAYTELIAELERFGMGHVLDFVPNHMCIESRANIWWMDVLENGPCSTYATFFDINWQPVKKELTNKVLLPLLGDQYGKVLENGELRLVFDEGSFSVAYYETMLPLEPSSWLQILKYRLEVVEGAFSADAPPLQELLSIITALQHLPPTTEHDPEKVAERYREKEVVKKRLMLLCGQSVEILNFITENVAIFNGATGEPASFDLLDELLCAQVYRLSFWKVATEEINYRRFFDINALSAIRMEDPVVFRETHALVLRLIREGKVTGLRIDHVDGLYDPLTYLERLQKYCFIQRCLGTGEGPQPAGADAEAQWLKTCSDDYSRIIADHPSYKPLYIICEKILLKGEQLPEEWPVFGTTGYDFLNYLNGIFIHQENLKWLDRSYTRFIRQTINFAEAVYEKKKLVMQVSMSGEINTLGHYLNNISEKNRLTRDFTLISLTRAITEVIACFPVYRTYANSSTIREQDVQVIETAVTKAKRRNPAISTSIFDFLRGVLLLRNSVNASEGDRLEWLDFVMKFQQLTGPVTAKGLEDTAFYVYNRLVSLNEVGGAPDRFGISVDVFHSLNAERFRTFPHALVATATHDSKRGEDVRTRIDVLSEVPEKWQKALVKWSRLNKRKKTMVDGQAAPGRNDEYLLYQTLVGAWPVEETADPVSSGFSARIKEYMVKATREAKVHTSWINPNGNYEKALGGFIDLVLDDGGFIRDFMAFIAPIAHYGMFNSLSQVLLKIGSPGIPDFYQGTELWALSLVDPDNRRPVDFRVRREMLARLREREAQLGPARLVRELLASKEDGGIKLYLIYRALNYRRARRPVFDTGAYLPLELEGEKARHGCAFARRLGGETVIVAASRLIVELAGDPARVPVGREVWGDTTLLLPWQGNGARYWNVISDEIVAGADRDQGSTLLLAEVFADAPVAMLERIQ